MTSSPILQIDDVGAVRRLTLNRPAARNALGADLIAALLDAFADADAAPHVGAILLRGAGAGFCAGADLKETSALDREETIRAHADRLRQLLLAPSLVGKPVIAEVHGFALGAGCALALACDMAFSTADARFGYPEVRHAMLPALVVPVTVQRLGRARAFDLLASGRGFDGREAERLGLVEVVEDPAATAAARAAQFAAVPAGIVGNIKALIGEVDGVPLAAGLDRAAAANVRARVARLAEKEGAGHG